MMMKVNFIIEGSMGLKYLGCSTVSKQLMHVLIDKGINVSLNSKKDGFDLVHAHTFGPLAIAQKRKTTSIISAHSTPSINIGNIVTGSRSFWKKLYQKIYNGFDYVFAVSHSSIKELEEIGITKPIYVLENGVDNSFFHYDDEKGKIFRENNNYSSNDYIVLNVAQITPRKGVYDFISVAKKNPDVQFLWIGGFPYFIGSSDYFRIKKLFNTLPDNIRFTGFVEDIIAAYSGADLLFTPTYRETFGLTIIEASACFLPVLARKIDVFQDLFSDHIFYGKTIEEFSRAINKKPERKDNGLYKKYDIRRIADDTISLYDQIINGELS